MAPTAHSAPSAAVLLVGDELLSGKIRDENGDHLAKFLRRRGIRLREIAVVADDLEAIGEAVVRLAARASFVFTSGGVGPTHDDVTLAAIARATDRPLQRDTDMEALLRAHYGGGINDAALRMAMLPAGTQLRALPGWPVLRLDLTTSRLYILPGVPGLLRAKLAMLEGLEGELPAAEGWHLEVLYTDLDESLLAPLLDDVVARFPEVDIGSYPRWTHGADRQLVGHVRVTLEARNSRRDQAVAARTALIELIPRGRLLADAPQ